VLCRWIDGDKKGYIDFRFGKTGDNFAFLELATARSRIYNYEITPKTNAAELSKMMGLTRGQGKRRVLLWKGKTPAEVAGIKIQGENKWITVIQNASRRYVTDN
jgi:hypothetical protein